MSDRKSFTLHYAGRPFALGEESAHNLQTVLTQHPEQRSIELVLEDGRSLLLALGAGIPVAVEELPSSAYLDDYALGEVS